LPRARVDLTGKKFGRLLVIKALSIEKTPVSKKYLRTLVYYLCKCDCGNFKVVLDSYLRRGTQSCGCLGREKSRTRPINEKHNLIGKRFGRLTVIDLSHINGARYWTCKCDCGMEKVARSDALKEGRTKSCGCIQKERLRLQNERNTEDLSGQRFNRLTVVCLAEKKGRRTAWLCACDCGNDIITTANSLKKGDAQSCGCIRKELVINRNHEMSGDKHPLWNPDKTLDDRISTRKYAEYYKWRFDIYKKDNFICQCCGKHGSATKINAHHLDSYARYEEKRLDINNGITLCEDCHKKFHSTFGKITKKVQLYEFLKEQKSCGNIETDSDIRQWLDNII